MSEHRFAGPALCLRNTGPRTIIISGTSFVKAAMETNEAMSPSTCFVKYERHKFNFVYEMTINFDGYDKSALQIM